MADLARMGAEALDEQTREVTKELRSHQKEEDLLYRKLSKLLHLMSIQFERKNPKEKLLGFQTFNDWMSNRVLDPHTGIGVSRRHAYYIKGIATKLFSIVDEGALKGIGFNNLKALTTVAETKHEVPQELIDFAKSHDSPEVWEKCDIEVFRGNQNHNNGRLGRLVIVCGQKQLDTITKLIEKLKSQVGSESEADVLEYALVELDQSGQKEEAHAIAEISGIPEDYDFEDGPPPPE